MVLGTTLLFVAFAFFPTTGWQHWCTITQFLIHCNALTFFNTTARHPHRVFVQLIIPTPIWTFACAVIRLHPVLSDHFSTLFSSSWSQSILTACMQHLPCCWYLYIYAVHHTSHLWKYWKCQTSADPSTCFIYWNLSLIFRDEVEEFLSSIALMTVVISLKKCRKFSWGLEWVFRVQNILQL